MTSLHVMELVRPIVLLIVALHARMNVLTPVKSAAAMIVLEVVKKAVQLDARQLAKANVRVHAPLHVLENAKALVQEAAQEAVVEVAKGLALAVVGLDVAVVVLAVRQLVQIPVRHKPHKDVTDAVIHAKQAVEANAIGLVVALVINSVKVSV